MSRNKKLCILLAALIVVSGVTYFVSKSEEKKEKIRNSDEVVLEIDPDSVTALSWNYYDLQLSFHKDGDVWKYDGDENFPLSDIAIYEILENFSEFGVSFIIEDVDDLSQYGLDDPSYTINITAGETDYSMHLGGYSTMDSKRYISIDDGNVYLAAEDPLAALNVDIDDLIDNDEVPSFYQVTGISFSGISDGEIVYDTDRKGSVCEDDVYYMDGLPLDSTAVESYISAIKSISLNTYVSYNVSDEELAKFGLDEPTLVIDVNYDTSGGESGEFRLSIGEDQEELAEAETEDVNVTKYVRVGDSGIVYQLILSKFNTLTACSYDDLRHKEVFTASFDTVNRIEIALEGNDHSVIRAEEDGKTVWRIDEEDPFDISELQNAIEVLAASSADDFTDEGPTERKEIGLVLYLDNEAYPQVTIDLYRYDGSSCLALLDGEPFALISRSSVVDLIEEINSIIL